MKVADDLNYTYLDESTKKQIKNIKYLTNKKELSPTEEVILTTAVRQLIKDDPKSIPALKGVIKKLKINTGVI